MRELLKELIDQRGEDLGGEKALVAAVGVHGMIIQGAVVDEGDRFRVIGAMQAPQGVQMTETFFHHPDAIVLPASPEMAEEYANLVRGGASNGRSTIIQ